MEYAFRIYDFDEDDCLSIEDITEVVGRLTSGQRLEDSHLSQLVNSILEEADLDQDGMLSYPEFEHVVSKAPDIVHQFKIVF